MFGVIPTCALTISQRMGSDTPTRSYHHETSHSLGAKRATWKAAVTYCCSASAVSSKATEKCGW